MSSTEPEKKKDPIKILLSREDAYIFYDLMRHLPLFDPTCEQEVVFNSVMAQLQNKIGD